MCSFLLSKYGIKSRKLQFVDRIRMFVPIFSNCQFISGNKIVLLLKIFTFYRL